MNALFSIAKDGVVHALCGTHVDDFLYGARGEAELLMRKVLKEFGIEDEEHTSFRSAEKSIAKTRITVSTLLAKTTQKKFNRYDTILLGNIRLWRPILKRPSYSR